MLFLDLQVQWRRLVSVADKHVAMGGRGGGCREVSWGQDQIKDIVGGLQMRWGGTRPEIHGMWNH